MICGVTLPHWQYIITTLAVFQIFLIKRKIHLLHLSALRQTNSECRQKQRHWVKEKARRVSGEMAHFVSIQSIWKLKGQRLHHIPPWLLNWHLFWLPTELAVRSNFLFMFIPTLLMGFAEERDRLIPLELHFLYTPVNCKNLVSSGGSGFST